MPKTLHFVLLLVICACTKNEISSEHTDKSLSYRIIELFDSLGIYTIDAPVREFEGDYFIFDRSQNNVARVNQQFTKVNRLYNISDANTDDSEVYGFDILGDRLFLRSPTGFTVFNLHTNTFIGFFRNPFLLNQQLLQGPNGLFTTRFTSTGLEVVSFSWDDEQGFHSISRIAEIPNSRNITKIDQSGWLLVQDSNLVYIDEWSGEYYVIDSSLKKVISKDRLPLGGPIGENYEIDEEGFSFGTFKNAFSVATTGSSTFLVLREVDWEISDSVDLNFEKESDQKRIRRRVHHFNAKMEVINSYLLEDYANCIFYHDGKMFVNHTGGEKMYIYAID